MAGTKNVDEKAGGGQPPAVSEVAKKVAAEPMSKEAFLMQLRALCNVNCDLEGTGKLFLDSGARHEALIIGLDFLHRQHNPVGMLWNLLEAAEKNGNWAVLRALGLALKGCDSLSDPIAQQAFQNFKGIRASHVDAAHKAGDKPGLIAIGVHGANPACFHVLNVLLQNNDAETAAEVMWWRRNRQVSTAFLDAFHTSSIMSRGNWELIVGVMEKLVVLETNAREAGKEPTFGLANIAALAHHAASLAKKRGADGTAARKRLLEIARKLDVEVALNS